MVYNLLVKFCSIYMGLSLALAEFALVIGNIIGKFVQVYDTIGILNQLCL